MSDTLDLTQEDREEQKAPARDTLWVTDEECIRRLGVPRKAARAAFHMFDVHPEKGFPQKQALWGNRRYWPAVRTYFELHYGISMVSPNRRSQQ